MLLFSDGAAVCFRRLLCFSFQCCIPALKQLLPLTRGNKQPPTPAAAAVSKLAEARGKSSEERLRRALPGKEKENNYLSPRQSQQRICNAEREVIENVMVLSDPGSLNSECLQPGEKKRFEGGLQMLEKILRRGL